MKFSKYKYGYLIISSLENFRIEIANYNLATDLYKAIVDMKHTSKGQNKQHNNQNNSSLDNKSVKRNNIQPSVYDNKAVNNERKEFRDIMCRIIEKEGREIITQKRFVYMLEDLYSLQETPHVKHVLNLMLADGYMQKLLLKDKNTNLSYLSAQFSQKYMLRVDAVSEIFEDVMAVI